jgi:hypothetical protein
MAAPPVLAQHPRQQPVTNAARPRPRPGMVRLTPSSGSDLTLILNAPPDRSGGVGGWAGSERDGQRPAKWFKSQPDDTISLDCTLDVDAIGGPGIERRLTVLRDMGQPAEGEDEPPTIRLDGDIWPDDQHINWVMSNWSLGERLWNSDGTFWRHQVKIDLERYNALDEITAVKVRSTRKAGKRRRRVVQSRGNDTLRGIALRELGDATRWKDIQRWNKKKLKGVDPDARLRTGTHLTVR